MESEDLRTHLRRHFSNALRDQDRVAASTLRSALAALDNAEAVQPSEDSRQEVGEHFAGGVAGLGAAEVERQVINPDSQRMIVRAEVDARLAAAATYDRHGRSDRAADLRRGAEVLLAVLDEVAGSGFGQTGDGKGIE